MLNGLVQEVRLGALCSSGRRKAAQEADWLRLKSRSCYRDHRASAATVGDRCHLGLPIERQGAKVNPASRTPAGPGGPKIDFECGADRLGAEKLVMLNPSPQGLGEG